MLALEHKCPPLSTLPPKTERPSIEPQSGKAISGFSHLGSPSIVQHCVQAHPNHQQLSTRTHYQVGNQAWSQGRSERIGQFRIKEESLYATWTDMYKIPLSHFYNHFTRISSTLKQTEGLFNFTNTRRFGTAVGRVPFLPRSRLQRPGKFDIWSTVAPGRLVGNQTR